MSRAMTHPLNELPIWMRAVFPNSLLPPEQDTFATDVETLFVIKNGTLAASDGAVIAGSTPEKVTQYAKIDCNNMFNNSCTVDEQPNRHWPPGIYFTDGSGGVFSDTAPLRRCGVGLVCMKLLNTLCIDFAAYSNLPGKVQTVPRAELYAVLLVCQHVHEGQIVVYCDNLKTVDVFNKGKEFALMSANSDLWHRLFHVIESKHLDVLLKWIPSHVDQKPCKADKYNLEPFHIYGNVCADFFADKAATHFQIDSAVSSVVVDYANLVGMVQRRMVAVLASQPPRSRSHSVQEVRPPKHDSFDTLITNSKHSLVVSDFNVTCVCCHSKCNKGYEQIIVYSCTCMCQ